MVINGYKCFTVMILPSDFAEAYSITSGDEFEVYSYGIDFEKSGSDSENMTKRSAHAPRYLITIITN